MKQATLKRNDLASFKCLVTNFGASITAHVYLTTPDEKSDKLFRNELLEEDCVRSCYTGLSGYEYTMTVGGPDIDSINEYLTHLRQEMPGVTYRAYVIGNTKLK